jgi:hypothetical protein
VLYPATDPGEVEAVRQACGELAHALSADLNIGMSGAFIRTRV